MDKPGKWTLIVAALAGLLVFLAYSLYPVPALTPEMNAELAVIQGLRPATGVFPGLWRYFAALLPPTPEAFGLAGRFLAAVFAFLSALAIRLSLARLLKTTPTRLWRQVLAPAVTLIVALLMSFAEPVWRIFSLFTPSAVLALLFMATIVLFESWLLRGSLWRLCLLMFTLGLLIAETPLALGLLVAFAICRYRIVHAVPDGREEDDEEDDDETEKSTVSLAALGTVLTLPLWRMFFSVMMGFGLGVLLGISFAISHDMIGSLGWTMSYIVFEWARAYVHQFLELADVTGWLMGTGLCVMPLVVLWAIFPKLTDDDRVSQFHMGLAALLCGLIAYFEQGPLSGAWFWTWIGDTETVSSPFFLSLFSCAASFTVAFSLAAFAYDATYACRARDRSKSLNAAYRIALLLVAAGAILLELPMVRHETVRKILAFNASAIRETIREANGAKWLFTDGSSDAALELEAHREGKTLYTVNLMGGADDYEITLRLRGITNTSDRLSAQMGAAVLMRVWACDKPQGLDESAMQLGLELWKRDQLKQVPQSTAFLARTTGLRPDDLSNVNEIVGRFTEEIEALSPLANEPAVPSSVRHEFFTISWRLSRLSRYRHDRTTAERLEGCNTALRKMLRDLEYERIRVFMQMTPREGLEFALKRADFLEAARYAAAVLAVSERDIRANFAMGMYYLLANRYENAEPHLRLVLEERPNEPVVLNNLSILCRKTQRYDEAVQLAEKALKVLPGNEEIEATLDDARAKRP